MTPGATIGYGLRPQHIKKTSTQASIRVKAGEQYESYRVAGKAAVVQSIKDAIEASGGRVLATPAPTKAPFLFRVQMPSGEVLTILCYAFKAERYRQGGRPPNEHRFQVKYGNDFQRYHSIVQPWAPDVVTLMFGLHFEMGVFIAVDPAMHKTTWFSKSVEFKAQHLQNAVKLTWHGWERQRVLQGRRRKSTTAPSDSSDLELLNAQDEALLAFPPSRFLNYVQFERLASGLPTGERLLVADKIGAAFGSDLDKEKALHSLEAELGLSAHEILDMIQGAFRLKVAVRGNAAERHLLDFVRRQPGVTDALSIDKDSSPDINVQYKGRQRRVLIECKTVGRDLVKGRPKVDFQKTRATQGNKCNRYYRPEQFNILAACLHPVSEQWEFRFCDTRALDAHATCPDRLDHKVFVDGPRWDFSLVDLLELITR